MAVGTVALLAVRARLLVGWPVIAAIAIPWMAMSLALRARPATWGREGEVLDWWSVPHFTVGILFGLFGIGGVTVVIVALLWELIELSCRVCEHAANRVADVALAFAGWIAAILLAGGAFTAW